MSFCFNKTFFCCFNSAKEEHSWNGADHFNFIVKVNHFGEDYLKIPLAYCTNYFWINYDRETKPFYIVKVVPHQKQETHEKRESFKQLY